MKDFKFNSLNPRAEQLVDEMGDLIKKKMGRLGQFAIDYPFSLEFPVYETIPDLAGGYVTKDWENGFRPKLEDIAISLIKVSEVASIASNPNLFSSPSDADFKNSCKECIAEFNELCNLRT